jgi:hypothetical protein
MKIKIPQFWQRFQSCLDKNTKSGDPEVRLLILPRRVDDYWFWLLPMSRKLKGTTFWSAWYDYCVITDPWGVWWKTRPRVFFAKFLICLPYVAILWILMWLVWKSIS